MSAEETKEVNAQPEQEGGEQKKKSKKKTVVIIILIILVAILIAIIVWLLTRGEEEKRNVVVTKDNVNEVIEQMAEAEYVEPGYYTVTMNNEWHFKDGSSVSSDAYVENVENNTNDVYFDLFLADDEENPILESPIIPRGASMKDIALDTPLENGTYDCVMIYHLVDEDQKSVDTLRVTVTIIVGE